MKITIWKEKEEILTVSTRFFRCHGCGGFSCGGFSCGWFHTTTAKFWAIHLSFLDRTNQFW